MSDKEKETQELEQPESSPPAEAKTTDTVPGSWDEIFQHPRFKSLLDRAKTAETKVGEFQTEQEKHRKEQEEAEKKRLKAEQKWQELAEQHEAKVTELEPQLEEVKTQLEAANAALANYAGAQLELVPEMYRPLVESLPVLKQLEWLTENSEKLAQKPSPNGGPTTPNAKGKGDLSPEQRRKLSTRHW